MLKYLYRLLMWFWPVNEMIELVSGMPAPQFGEEPFWVRGSGLLLASSGSCDSFYYFYIITSWYTRRYPKLLSDKLTYTHSIYKIYNICIRFLYIHIDIPGPSLVEIAPGVPELCSNTHTQTYIHFYMYRLLLLLLSNWTANAFLPGGSDSTIRNNTQRYTYQTNHSTQSYTNNIWHITHNDYSTKKNKWRYSCNRPGRLKDLWNVEDHTLSLLW
jgi:hypothetical protein